MRVAFVALTIFVLAGCTGQRPAGSTGTEAETLVSVGTVSEVGMPCTQATGIARQTLVKLGYTVDSVAVADAQKPGRVVGKRNTGWTPRVAESGDVFTTVVAVKCSDNGATLELFTDEGFTKRLGMRRDFESTVASLITRKVTRPRVKEEPDRGLLISVEPQRGRDAGAEFGADLPASGVTPVRLKIENRTDRTYGFQRKKVKLVTQEGRRVKPLPAQEIGKRLGNPLESQLEAKLIAEGDLTPGASRIGFMYFPAAAYRRATIILLDRESDEPEGFSVEF